MIWNPKLSSKDNERLTQYVRDNASHALFMLRLSGLRRAFRQYVDSDVYEDEDAIARLGIGFFDAHYRIARYLGTNSDDELHFMPEWIEANVIAGLNLTSDEKHSLAQKMSERIMLEVYRNL